MTLPVWGMVFNLGNKMKKVMINSLPKSGTKLLTSLIKCIGFSFSGTSFSSMSVHGRYFRAKTFLRGTLPFSQSTDVGLDITANVRYQWIISKIRKVKTMQYIGGHLPYSDQMGRLLDDNNISIIYLLRDPRAVITSWAHYVPKTTWHYGKKGLDGCSLDDRVIKLLNGYKSGSYNIEGFRNILRRMEGWFDNKRVHIVRFEELVGTKGGGSLELQHKCIESIIDFLNIEKLNIQRLSNQIFGGTTTFRKGQIESWKEELSPLVQEEIKDVLRDKIIYLGYKL